MSSDRSAADDVLPARPSAARTRLRRQLITFGVLISTMLLVGVAALGNWVGWWTIGGAPAPLSNACPVQTYTLPQLVRVNVYNGTTRRGLASSVASELHKRKFFIGAIATAVQTKPLTAVAQIRYGEFGLPGARTVAKQFPGAVTMVRDGRNTRTVDVVLGSAYSTLQTRAKSAAAIKLTPQPDGCIEPSATPSAPTPSGT